MSVVPASTIYGTVVGVWLDGNGHAFSRVILMTLVMVIDEEVGIGCTVRPRAKGNRDGCLLRNDDRNKMNGKIKKKKIKK